MINIQKNVLDSMKRKNKKIAGKEVNNVTEKYVGITLMFSLRDRGEYYGIQRSYIIRDGENIIIKSKQIANSYKKDSNGAEINYLGLYDVFDVTITDTYNNLGCSFYDEYDSLATAKRMKFTGILADYKTIPFKEKCLFIVKFIYYLKSNNRKYKSTTAVFSSVISVNNYSELIDEINTIVETDIFIDNIMREVNYENDFNPKFIGFQDIYPISSDMIKDKCFEQLYKNFQSKKQVEEYYNKTKKTPQSFRFVI